MCLAAALPSASSLLWALPSSPATAQLKRPMARPAWLPSRPPDGLRHLPCGPYGVPRSPRGCLSDGLSLARDLWGTSQETRSQAGAAPAVGTHLPRDKAEADQLLLFPSFSL